VVGVTFVVDLTNLPNSPFFNIPFAMLGFRNDRWAGGSLPLDLAILGMPGCSLLTSSDDALTLSNQGGSAALPIAMPADPAIVGQSFFIQGAVMDRAANPMGLVLSNGLEIRVGTY